ncbi:DNA polymerase III subunit delta' [Amylibacter kogurei]|uniref:DNA polymerase III subunit delta n=1 Tax=Paramylibacter kogurei TaxID=1889778 RepID=A0A2G5K6A0_9RHOB|nr:DNA polymerase III subunit delta' [Amylibacter kogurei]PIB24542.1 DNA polymerase III subunit delta' [Amylibacter kogurei]
MSDDSIPQSDVIDGAPHPRLTEKLIGQSAAEDTFLTAFNSGRLHHAWLINGPRGVGKSTLAWRIARFLLAQPDDDGGMFVDAAPTPTNLSVPVDHPVARRIAALGEPRLFLARRPYDEKSKKLKQAITVEEVRKLKSFFNFSAADGGWRVAIVDAADELNTAAANALLKILEEPPEKVILLLVCHQPARLLPTIRSRCRELRCVQLNETELDGVLAQAGFEASQNSLALATLADGSAGQAIQMLGADGLKLYASIVSIAARAPGLDRGAALTLANACVGKAAEQKYDMTLRLFATFLARLARHGALQPSTVIEAAQGEASLFAKLAPNAAAARKWANLLQEITSRSTHARAVNLDPSSVILDMFLKLDETARN